MTMAYFLMKKGQPSNGARKITKMAVCEIPIAIQITYTDIFQMRFYLQ